jgi:signal transduction histidine kinase
LSSILFKIKTESPGLIFTRIFGHTLGVAATAIFYMQLGGTTPIIPVTLLLIAFFLIQDLYEEFNARNLTFVLINAILFSALMSVVIFYAALQKNKTVRFENVNKVMGVLTDDELGMTQLVRDSLINSNLIPSLASLTYPSPMDRNELMSYIDDMVSSVDTLNLFDVEAVECYDQVGNSLFFNHISNYQNNNELIVNSKRLDNNLYHLPLNNVTSIFFQINNDDFPYSPINMIIKLSKSDWSNDVQVEEKNYLVYKNNNLIYSFSNDFLDFDRKDPSLLEESNDIGDMSYVVYSPDGLYKIIDYQEVSGLIKPISFFSLIFIICGILLGFFTIFNYKLKILPDELDFTFYSQSSLRSKIQLSVILLIVFSFFVIGIITTVYFKNIVSFNDRSKFKSDLKTIINDVQNKLTETLDAESAANIISKEFSELENIYSRRFAYYNNNGRMVIKSQQYNDAFNYIPYGILHSFSAEESTIKTVSVELEDEQVLIPIYLKEYQPQGFLTMHYSSQRSISSGIYNHLSNLMNVYIFLFFLAGALSIFIANSITEPLARLREGVKKFKLGRINEPLEYESNDELGVLIKEYNNMTEQLEHSASIIAKTERDIAWREMAKQVAHEIKNPLTPMKLHLQHLENTVRSSPERAQDMIKKVSSTLIEQINNLTNIANEFSNYATLPKADNIKTNLNEVVEHVHDLFRERDDMDISMNEPIEDLIVFADRNHLVRIVVNIIKNAIQSIPQDRKGKIEISLEKVDGCAKLSIQDNGSGIPDNMKNKIFTPNFTTKSSGTGLGLAICVNMLDTMNGKIYFESTEHVGTTFYIEIPIMRNEFSDDDISDDVFLED